MSHSTGFDIVVRADGKEFVSQAMCLLGLRALGREGRVVGLRKPATAAKRLLRLRALGRRGGLRSRNWRWRWPEARLSYGLRYC